MATAPAQPIRPRREMQEVKAPEQFQFAKQGSMVEGIFLNIEPKEIEDKTSKQKKQVMEYMFQLENRERLTFLGSWDLDRKLNPGLIGHFVSVRYERDDDSFAKSGQNAAKIFKVVASKEKESGF